MSDINRVLHRIAAGDPTATQELLPLVYDELRNLAAAKLAWEKPGQTLDATGLVHEAYLKLVSGHNKGWDSKAHFFGAAAEAMRRLLVDHARRKKRLKHGGGLSRRELIEVEISTPEPREDLVALDAALTKLSDHDPTAAQLVQLRYFTGMTIEETAKVLGLSKRSAERLWKYARAWLHQETMEGMGEN